MDYKSLVSFEHAFMDYRSLLFYLIRTYGLQKLTIMLLYTHNNSGRNSPSQPTTDLTSMSEVNGQPALHVVSMSSTPAIFCFCFLNRDYRHKSVAIQILHDAG